MLNSISVYNLGGTLNVKKLVTAQKGGRNVKGIM
jgi:hypothetical protein